MGARIVGPLALSGGLSAASRARSAAVQRRLHEPWLPSGRRCTDRFRGSSTTTIKRGCLMRKLTVCPNAIAFGRALRPRGYTHEQRGAVPEMARRYGQEPPGQRRKQLRGRLTRRGMRYRQGLLIAGLSPAATRAAIPADRLNATVRTALKFAEHSATAARPVPPAAAVPLPEESFTP